MGEESIIATVNNHVTQDCFEQVISNPQVEDLLEELEIAVANPNDIFQVLDADGNGYLDVAELTKGFMKLRGPADKSDAVASSLKLSILMNSAKRQEKAVRELRTAMSQMQSMLFYCAAGNRMFSQHYINILPNAGKLDFAKPSRTFLVV